MSSNNRVVWSEGLFLQPQHFQQQDRHFEQYLEARCNPLTSYSWGFTDVEIERGLLTIGKLALSRATGIFPDGTPFRMPEDEPLPEPIDIDPLTRDQIVYLGVPRRGAGTLDAVRGQGRDELARYSVREWQVRDVGVAAGESATLEVGSLRTRLLLASQVTPAYECLPVAHVSECRADKFVTLSESFIPTVIRCRASARLLTFARELTGLLHQRGDNLKDTAVEADSLGLAGYRAFLWLLTVNRYEPLFQHASEGALHPEEFYRLCVMAAGELATFTPAKRSPMCPPYQHDRLRESFLPVVESLRASLNEMIPRLAIPLPLDDTGVRNVRRAKSGDPAVFRTSRFVLAVKAHMPDADLRKHFPSLICIGDSDRIGELIVHGLPGVPVRPLPVAPAEIPFHAGHTYFELDQNNSGWQPIAERGALALQVSKDFPGLTMELWAILRRE